MLDIIQDVFKKVQANELSKNEAMTKLESLISFKNETEDNVLLAFAVAELYK